MHTFPLELQYIVTANKSHTWEKGGPCLLFVSIEAGGAQRVGARGVVVRKKKSRPEAWGK